jgi:hypothetical protein
LVVGIRFVGDQVSGENCSRFQRDCNSHRSIGRNGFCADISRASKCFAALERQRLI